METGKPVVSGALVIDPNDWAIDNKVCPRPKKASAPSSSSILRTRKTIVASTLRYLTHRELRNNDFVIDTIPKFVARSKRKKKTTDLMVTNKSGESEPTKVDPTPAPAGAEPVKETVPCKGTRVSDERKWRPRRAHTAHPFYHTYFRFRYVRDKNSAKEQKSLFHDTTYFIEYLQHSMEYLLTLPNKKLSGEEKNLLRVIRLHGRRYAPLVCNLKEYITTFEFAMRLKHRVSTPPKAKAQGEIGSKR